MAKRLLLLTLTCALTAACQKTPPSTIAEARDICLADPDGGLPLDEAIRHAQKQASDLSHKPDGWVLAGRGWVRKARVTADPGFYINVKACADAALNVDRNSVMALELRGLALMNNHQFREARDVAREILSRDPKDLIGLGLRSDALLELGEFENAAAATQQMIDTRPDMASYSRASYVRWLQGDTRSAKLLMRYALGGRDGRDREPAAWTFVQAAVMYWNEGDYEGSDAVLEEALGWVADYPPALAARARVALSQGQPERAIEYLERIPRNQRLPEMSWLLGDAREMSGDAAGARQEYERVVRDGRKNDRLTLALFYATKNLQIDEALRLIEEERAVRGGIYVDDTYAWVLYRAGRIADARAAIDGARRLRTNDARILYHAGAIRLASGDREGRDLIREALHLNPRFDWSGAAEAATLLRDDVHTVAP